MPFATNPSIAFTTGFTGACAMDDNIQLQFGSGTDYWFLYRSAGTALELNSTNVNGAGADGIVFKVEDGTNEVDFIGGITVADVTAVAAVTCSTIVASGIVKTDDATDATSGTDGSLQTDGGLSVVKDIFAGNDILIATGGVINFNGGDVTLTHASNVLTMAGGVFSQDDTTDSTSTTTGSVHTDGGLGVAKDAFFGNDIDVAGRLRLSTVTTLDNTGTPTVAAGNVFKTGGTTAITDFDDGVVGQTIKILSAHTVTITDSAIIDLAGGGDYSMTATDTLTLTMYNDQVWVEDGRSVNGG